MTDPKKALPFARHWLKLKNAHYVDEEGIVSGEDGFDPESAEELQAELTRVLATKYTIQFNRGKTDFFAGKSLSACNT
jgi:hypothetical protein